MIQSLALETALKVGHRVTLVCVGERDDKKPVIATNLANVFTSFLQGHSFPEWCAAHIPRRNCQ